MRRVLIMMMVMVGVLLGVGATVFAVSEDFPDAEIVNDEGGAVTVSGILTVTNPNVKSFSTQPVIVLEDQANFVERDYLGDIPQLSQVYAHFLNDFFAESEIAYEMVLPAEPQGTLNDVDQNGADDAGVQIYQVALGNNRFGDIYLDGRDTYGWSGDYSSVATNIDPRLLGEYLNGTILVWSPDDKQGFPSGFGADGLLFTADDPIVGLPQGYTTVTLAPDGFTFDRSRQATIDLLESEGAAPDDFSQLSYTEAFEALVEKARNEYVFNDMKGMDYDALLEKYTPMFEEADDQGDPELYQYALALFALEFKDGHVQLISPRLEEEQQASINGGLGFAVRELSDGRIVVVFVLDGGPADEVGMEVGAELIGIDGMSIQEAIDAEIPPNSPYSSRELERVDKIRFVVRFDDNMRVEVVFKNPDSNQEETVTLETVDERDSVLFTRQFVYPPTTRQPESPLSWEILPSGYGYVKVTTFGGFEDLLINNWEYFMLVVNALETPGIIIDLRENGGGFSAFGNRIASYLYDTDEDIFLYSSEEYNPIVGGFYNETRFPTVIEPVEPEKRYLGNVAVLVGPNCASACEYFGYALTRNERAAVVGVYGTNSIGGGWFPTYMPEDITFPLPTRSQRDADGNIVVEELGIQPTIRIPITEENMLDTSDIVLAGAIEYLDSAIAGTTAEVVEGEILELDTPLDGTIEAGTRVNHEFNTGDGGTVNFVIEGDANAFIYILLPDGTVAADGTTPDDPGFEGVELPPNFDLIVQVITEDDAGEGNYTLTIETAP
jgi:C-terminal processing protease CtpA/Prc